MKNMIKSPASASVSLVTTRPARICNPSPQRQENNYAEIASCLAMTF